MKERRLKTTRIDQDLRAGIHSALPKFELYIYCSVFIGSTMFASYSVYEASNNYKNDISPDSLEPGWTLIGRQKDVSNVEWAFWSRCFRKMWPYLILHVVMGRLVEHFLYKWRKYIFLAFSLMFHAAVLGPSCLILILSHCVVIYLMALFESVMVVWTTALLLLSTLNLSYFKELQFELEGEDVYRFYLLQLVVAICNIRYISFCVERCWVMAESKPEQIKQTGQTSSEIKDRIHVDVGHLGISFIDMLMYVMYFPLCYTGPVMTYNDFRKQFNVKKQSWSTDIVVSLSLELLRVLFWALFNEVFLHFFYFNGLQDNIGFLQSIDMWTFLGLGYLQAQFFMLKYVIMFGLPSCLAKFDQFLPPSKPRCISHVYLFSDHWKYFDQGLHNFMKRYIYIPLGGSRNGVLLQLLASFLCFAFVFFWHGGEHYLLVWTVFSFVGISIESLGGHLMEVPSVKKFEMDVLSGAMVRRLHAVLAVPLYLLCMVAIFTFYLEWERGYLYFERTIISNFPERLLFVSAIVYCCVQGGMEVKRYQFMKSSFKRH